MRGKHKLALAAGVVVLAAAPTVYVLQERAEAAEREALEQAVEELFQAEADRDVAGRTELVEPDRVWQKFDAEAVGFDVTRDGSRATVDVTQTVTMYTTDRRGGDLRAEVPSVATRILVFESVDGDWRMVEDVTERELAD
ncbi:hypothetical protein [Streptomyces indicus]|uniref:DUF4440 domain-containing protein n=1 Tax=Streptomyces indicus TaxID=417292 RepID=A0A1G9G6V9_9ACTN|nr:hypothetical protein [Streptomyces indicus]SDK96420.1 hypothetical protein SAMN05421806_11516 [Streptomyces indicus]